MKRFGRIAMLSTHGYFDPIPRLGQTDTGGQVVYVLELAKAIARKGTPVDIYTRWFDQSQQQVNPVPGHPDVRVIRIAAGPWEFLPKEFIYDVLPELADNMIDFISGEGLNYDLFHGHYVDAGIVALDVARRMDKPCYFTAHSIGAWKRDQMGGDPEEMESRFNFNLRISEELRLFNEVNAQSFTSWVQREKVKELCDFGAENIEIIPPGVDIHRFYPAAEGQTANPSLPDNYIYCISRMDTNKGHDLLLRAFTHVAREDKDIHLIIAGGSPNPKPREEELLDKLQQIINSEGIRDRVTLIGYVEDEFMAANYQFSRFFVLPSLFEPFGMTTQEAMSCGRAVIASKFGGIRNVIENGINGFLVDPTKPEEFAAVMLQLLSNRPMAEKVGREARILTLEQFSWEAIADRHLDFYEKYFHQR